MVDFMLIRRNNNRYPSLDINCSIIRTVYHIIKCVTNYSAGVLILETVIDCKDKTEYITWSRYHLF